MTVKVQKFRRTKYPPLIRLRILIDRIRSFYRLFQVQSLEMVEIAKRKRTIHIDMKIGVWGDQLRVPSSADFDFKRLS